MSAYSGSLSSNVKGHEAVIDDEDSASDVFTESSSLSVPSLPSSSSSSSSSKSASSSSSSSSSSKSSIFNQKKAEQSIKDVAHNLTKEYIPIIDTLGQLREILKLSNLSEETMDALATHLMSLKLPNGTNMFKNELEAKKFLDDIKQGGTKKALEKLNWRSDVAFSRLSTEASHAKPNNPMLRRGLYRSNNSFYRY